MAAVKQQRSLRPRGRFWLRHLERWRQSGLSQAQYCRQQQLSAPAFGWWKGRLSTGRRPAASGTVKSKRGGQEGTFVELALPDSGETGASGPVVYEIALPNHRCLRLGYHFEPERVRQLLEVLESAC